MKKEVIIKTFIAAKAPLEVLKVYEDIKNKINFKNGKIFWENNNNIHLTLKYIGSTLHSEIDNITEIIENVIKNIKVIKLFVKKTGVFPNSNRPRFYWLGIQGEIDRLNQMVDEIDDSLSKKGYPKEKKFYKPHIIIGKSYYPQKHTPSVIDYIDFNYKEIDFTINELTLYQILIKNNIISFRLLKNFSLKTSNKE